MNLAPLNWLKYHWRIFRFFFKNLPAGEWWSFIPWMFLDVVITEDSRMRAPLFCRSLTIINGAGLFSHENVFVRSAFDARGGKLNLYASHLILGDQRIRQGLSDA